MHAMESLIKLFNEWEIQLFVLLSFTIQLILFFTGSLRRHSTSWFLRLFIWTAYLGADLAAVYALGLLSRHETNITILRTQPLAFFWAPFLLIHLGGQDTITAFAMEDNDLWLRHLLNLVVQVALAFHVFWRSIRRHGVGLLVSGIFVFVAGIIKYGERALCLKCGRLKGLESLTRNMSPEEINVDAGGYSRTVREALSSMPSVLMIFSASGYFASNLHRREDTNEILKVVRLQLGLMYEELYTKTLVLRSRSVMIFRHISQISIVVAFAIFHANDKQRYVKADVAITYSLFIGGFFLEVCAMLNSMMSPWTWSMLKGRKWERLARLSWFIFSSDIGWPEKKQRWPSSIGQYNFLRWLNSRDQQPRTLGQGVMTVVRRVFVDLVGAKKEKLFWMSKVLDTWYVDADEMTMECVAKEIARLDDELGGRSPTREWPNLGSLLKKYQTELDSHGFGYAIVHLHVLTELHLSKYPPPSSSDMEAAAAAAADGMVEVCRKLSNYMMYILVAHPSMLPLTSCTVSMMQSCNDRPDDIARDITREMDAHHLQPSKETVEEMVHMWTRLLLYAAGKSRIETHAAQLSTGGELITLAWLLMAFYMLGDLQARRIHIINTADDDVADKVYAFNIIARTS